MAGITQFSSTNIKRLKAVRITPNGNIVPIGGRNGQGKTSVLDSIMYALGGAKGIPGKPIRDGEERGEVELKIDGQTITRTITEKGSYLKVTNDADGSVVPKAQNHLDQLVGKLSFDPLAFSRMDAKKQAEELRTLVGIDTSSIDEKRDEAYRNRTEINRQISVCEAKLGDLDIVEDAPDEEISLSDLVEQADRAKEHNENISRAEKRLSQLEAKQNEIQQKIKELQSENEKTKAESAKWLSELERLGDTIETESLRDAIRDADAKNFAYRHNMKIKEMQQALSEEKERSNQRTQEIKDLDEDRRKLIASAEYPIEGLGLSDDGVVLFNGIPFSQASSAEKIRVSVSIGLAMNPKLPIMLIRDGSLLDDDSLALLGELAEQNDAQVWIERVGTDDEGAFIIEDGEVVGAERGEAVQA